MINYVCIDILSQTNNFLSIDECTFLADKGYDVKEIYNTVKNKYHGECVIPLNKRNTKDPKKLVAGNIICEAGLAMHKDGKSYDRGRTRQKFCFPLKSSKNCVCPCNHKNWIADVSSGLLSLTITDFPSTVNVCLLKSFILFVLKLKDTIQGLNKPVRNDYGFAISNPLLTLTLLLIFLCLLLLR